MSAPSTPCTRPPGRSLSAATPCLRRRSRLCAEPACAPGGSARSPPPRWSCSTASTAAPHDQQAPEAVTDKGSVPRPYAVILNRHRPNGYFPRPAPCRRGLLRKQDVHAIAVGTSRQGVEVRQELV